MKSPSQTDSAPISNMILHSLDLIDTLMDDGKVGIFLVIVATVYLSFIPIELQA